MSVSKINKVIRAKGKRYLYSLMEEHLVMRPDGTVTYTPVNFNDNRILDMAVTKHPTAEITLSMVTGLRARAWGKLYCEPVKTDAERIAELEALVDKLITREKDIAEDTLVQEFKSTTQTPVPIKPEIKKRCDLSLPDMKGLFG